MSKNDGDEELTDEKEYHKGSLNFLETAFGIKIPGLNSLSNVFLWFGHLGLIAMRIGVYLSIALLFALASYTITLPSYCSYLYFTQSVGLSCLSEQSTGFIPVTSFVVVFTIMTILAFLFEKYIDIYAKM